MRFRLCALMLALALMSCFSNKLVGAPLYFNGFETDTAGWTAATRVASGTNGIPSAAGGFHAQAATGSSTFTNWGGYNYGAGGAVPTVFQEYRTSAQIYLDINGGWANNTRLDFDSAINNSAGNFLRDFIFNGGFYNDSDGSPGSGTNRFIFSASNNSQPGSAFAKNPARDPVAISTTGWYTFEHHFYDNGGVLAVDMSIFDPSNNLVNMWTLTNGDAIAGVGGNRYGWFDFNEFSTLAFDNTQLTVGSAVAEVPEPASLLVWSIIGGAAVLGYRRKRAARVS
jgi:hypothetical protein